MLIKVILFVTLFLVVLGDKSVSILSSADTSGRKNVDLIRTHILIARAVPATRIVRITQTVSRKRRNHDLFIQSSFIITQFE